MLAWREHVQAQITLCSVLPNPAPCPSVLRCPAVLIMLFNGIAEMSMTVERLSVFHKQRNNHFYDAFSFVMPGTIMRIPYSLLEAVVWTVLSYFPVGLAGQPDR